MQPLLSVEGLSVEFRSRERTVHAVKDLSLTVGDGETVAIVGESGSGKSVTALSIMRLIEQEGGMITAGAIRLRQGDMERDIVALQPAELQKLRGKAVSMIFQEPMTSLNPVLSIGDQLSEVLMRHNGVSRDEALAEARRMLDRVRISDAGARLRQYPHELSGGMRQRVMIAMALLCRPKLLIADEPTTALDVTVQAQVIALLRELQRELAMSMLFITHDLGVVAEVADRVVVMRHGERVEEAGCVELYARPRASYTRALIAAVPRLGEEAGPSVEPGDETLLAVSGLTKRFPIRKGLFRRTVGHVHAVENVSFDIRAGETLALVGESGCGKSTTGRLVMRLLEPTEGQVLLGGRDVHRVSRADMRSARRDMQMIFQDPYASLNPRMKAADVVTEPLAIFEPSVGSRQRRERALELLSRVELGAEHLDRYPHQFSGGQRQRLCIARALCLNPKLIVADEPVSALDVSVQAQVLKLMRTLQEELGISYLFISHDMGTVERMSHRVAVMYMGEIVEIGPTREVLHAPRHAYTKQLLAAVPVPDPSRRLKRVTLDARELPSPLRALGDLPVTRPLVPVAPGHLVQAV